MTRFSKRWEDLDSYFPDKPFKKHPESRMGKGKGSPEGWVAVVGGTVMFKMAGVKEETAREALRLAAQKLPIQARFVEIEK